MSALTLMAAPQIADAIGRDGSTPAKARIGGTAPAFDEQVAIDATLNIVVKGTDTDTTVHMNVQRSTATGQTTGNRYQFHGADKIVMPGPPPAEGTVLIGGLVPELLGAHGAREDVPLQIRLTFRSGELTGVTASIAR